MRLTDHVTDVQLNEYLDNESSERAQIEAHVAECADCAARLTALQALFAEIESLPELASSRNLAAPFTRPSDLPAQLPRWLTLTASLQAVVALIAMILAAPIVSRYLMPYLQTSPIPPLKEVVVELQMSLAIWIQSIQSLQFPAIPTGALTLPKELSTVTLTLSFIGIFLFWVIGNWWLLSKRSNSLV